MADRVGCIGVDALYMVRNLPVLGRWPEHLCESGVEPRLRLRRPSSADCAKRYAARRMVYVSACCRWAILKDLSFLARVDDGLNW
jgi:hypothetical protein